MYARCCREAMESGEREDGRVSRVSRLLSSGGRTLIRGQYRWKLHLLLDLAQPWQVLQIYAARPSILFSPTFTSHQMRKTSNIRRHSAHRDA